MKASQKNEPQIREKIPETKVDYQKKKEFDRKLRKVENKLRNIEKNIEGLEKEVVQISDQLKSPENISDQGLFDKYGELQEEIEKKMQEWEIVHVEVEKLQDKRF